MSEHSAGPGPGDILVMAGTRKGAFLFWSDGARLVWRRSHHHMGWAVHAITYDARDGSILAATNSDVFGALVQRTRDGGATWQHFNQGLDFDGAGEERVRQVWQVEPGHASQPERLWAGTREAGLFRSDDGGATWAGVASLNERRERDGWMEGGGGLILHTIIQDPSDPQRIYAAISAGGAYRSDDGGATWRPINRNVRAGFLPDPYPETGQCVHKMALHPARPNVLFQQNHDGVYRSDDCGDSWVDISAGLPSRFGFPLVVHPHDPRTVYVVPLTADERRVTPDGQMALWRTKDDGATWQRLDRGLPANAWLTVLRDALAVDPADPAGIYVGTKGGQLFFSRNEGDDWETLADYLPPVLAVSAAHVVG